MLELSLKVFERVFLADQLRAPSAKPNTERIVAKQTVQRCDELLGVAWWDQKPVDTVFHQIRRSSAGGSYDWFRECHCFQENQSEPLATAGHSKYVCVRIARR